MTDESRSPLNSVFQSRNILWIFSVLAFQHILLLWLFYWPGSLPDGVTSGVWMGLAMDFAKDEFYRPLISEVGYGGTRYMPLFWVLHGLGIKWFGNPLSIGLALFFISLLIFHTGLFALMRQIKIPWKTSLAFAFLPMATLSYQMTTLTLRGDFLAAGFGIWGLWAVARSQVRQSKYSWVASIILFGLAFSTKLTSLYFSLAACLFIFFKGKRVHSLRLAGSMVWISTFIIGLSYFSSDGKFWDAFSATLTGGMNPDSALSFLSNFGTELIRDPFFFVIFLLSTGTCFNYTVRSSGSLDSIYFFVTLASTLFIYTSPGTATNHLIDLQAACAVLAASNWNRSGTRMLWNPVFLVMGFYLILAWHPKILSVSTFFAQHEKPRVETVDWMKKKYPERSQKILSRFSYFEILQNKRPFILDRFNLNLLTKTDQKIGQDFENRIRNRYFGLVVESNWPGLFKRDFDSPSGSAFESMKRDFHRHYDQDDPWHTLIRQYYRVDSVYRPFVFLVPRTIPVNPPVSK